MRVRLVLLAAVVLLPAALALLLLRTGARGDARPAAAPVLPDAPRPGLTGSVDRLVGGALDPGPLSQAHAALAGVSGCLDCHGKANHVLDERCVACHGEIGIRAQRRIPWHGSFTEPCRTCHAEHRGADAALIELDRDAFQHAQTRFPLRGAHAGAKCEECHRVVPLGGEPAEALHFQGVPFAECTGCHVDPHSGGKRARESLGVIRQVALDAPAAAAAFASAPASASAGADAAHADSLIAGRDCAECHAQTGFRAAQLRRGRFDHAADTHFALLAAHSSVACEACHTAERRAREQAQGLPPGHAAGSDCADCHEDPHRGKLRGADGCRSCHSEEGWAHGFDHARDTRFALDELHAPLACGACHSDQRFRAAGRECTDCHVDAAQLIAGRFDGAQRAEADPHADGVACADCHRPNPAANLSAALARRCAECHTAEYAGLLGAWSARLDALSADNALPADVAERLRRSGVHNFALARALLGASAR